MTFRFFRTEHFIYAACNLPEEIDLKLEKCLKLLEENPKHPSLKTHKVKNARGDFGGDIFEAYIDKQYRLTWEYGNQKGMIVLRNCGNHNDCLQSP